MYFPYISARLKAYGLPDDLKYIPIIECGFRNLVSSAGARGFWQIMPDVARAKNMIVSAAYDERDNPIKSTEVACQLLRENYKTLQRLVGINSWVLTAAAYNFGSGNIHKTVRRQGQSDYFRMQLNAETAAYVYKLIAVKELFERPELYMSGFNANIFGGTATTSDADLNTLERGAAITPEEDFGSIEVVKSETAIEPTRIVYVVAQIVAEEGKTFRDGNPIRLLLKSNLRLPTSFVAGGTTILGHGWTIDNRVLIDLGHREVEVLDKFKNKGITPEEAGKDGQYVILKTEVPAN